VTMAPTPPRVYCGIDTHADTHHAAILTDTGILLANRQFDTTTLGYDDLVAWVRDHGHEIAVGVEGASSYGAGITRHLRHHDIAVVEVPRPNRKLRRSKGKSDLSTLKRQHVPFWPDTSSQNPKTVTDPLKQSVRCGSPDPARSMPQPLDERHPLDARHRTRNTAHTHLRGHSTTALLEACIALEPDTAALADPTNATSVALPSLARRTRELRREAQELKKQLALLVGAVAPRTSDVFGLGSDTAAALLVTVGDNPQRLRSESSFAHLCGVAPIPASSGKTNRHRLHRGGDRLANQALHTAVVVRLRYHESARSYAQRRTSEGKPMTEIIRCQKRYLVREVFTALRRDYRALAT
jgi:transposase